MIKNIVLAGTVLLFLISGIIATTVTGSNHSFAARTPTPCCGRRWSPALPLWRPRSPRPGRAHAVQRMSVGERQGAETCDGPQ